MCQGRHKAPSAAKAPAAAIHRGYPASRHAVFKRLRPKTLANQRWTALAATEVRGGRRPATGSVFTSNDTRSLAVDAWALIDRLGGSAEPSWHSTTPARKRVLHRRWCPTSPCSLTAGAKCLYSRYQIICLVNAVMNHLPDTRQVRLAQAVHEHSATHRHYPALSAQECLDALYAGATSIRG